MQYAIVTECNRCVKCYACAIACKNENSVPLGSHWTKILRVGPNPINEGDTFPDTEMYYLPLKCQHCANPSCVHACPTGASMKMPDGTVQIDKEKCIGCQFCVLACPYGVRYLNEEAKAVEKCTMCQQQLDVGGVPQCVAACTGRALHFGDIDDPNSDVSKLIEEKKEYVHHLPNRGNDPSSVYILEKMKWRFEE